MIAWAFHVRGIHSQIHYLMTFSSWLLRGLAWPRSNLDRALATLDYLGFPVSWNKIEGPSTRITFLGILVDMTSFELRLPDTKLVILKELNQEVVYKEGSGVLTWAFISCSISGKTRAYLPSEAVCSPARRITSHVFLQGHGQTWHGGGAFC